MDAWSIQNEVAMHRNGGLSKAIKFFGSQRLLAEALGIKQQAISNWLNREFKIPHASENCQFPY